MSPSQNYVFNSSPLEPVSRTYQYRKVMKPMLERKRRARINRCLDELKELMMVVLQSEGENVSKLEKADILELTVRHLQNLKQKNSLYIKPPSSDGNNKTHTNTDSFWEGFRHCANEVSQFLMKFDQKSNIDFIQHIKNCIPIPNLNSNSNNGNYELLHNSIDNKNQFSPPFLSNIPYVINRYNSYHQKIFMYNNGDNSNNLNEKNLTFLNNMDNRNYSVSNKSSKISSVLIDDNVTVWRPW